MRQAIIVSALMLIAKTLSAQKGTSIELNLGVRYDLHAKYNTTYNSMAPKEMKLWGIGSNLGINLKQSLTKKLSVYIGAGFYDLHVNRVRFKGGLGPSIKESRLVDYTPPDFSKPAIFTNNYHYYNISGSVGASYIFKETNQRSYIAGADIVALQNFAQRYNLNHPLWTIHSANRNRFLGYHVNALVGFTQKAGKTEKYYIIPKLLLPIYQSIRQDIVFFENESNKMNKWFNGIGISVVFGKNLK